MMLRYVDLRLVGITPDTSTNRLISLANHKNWLVRAAVAEHFRTPDELIVKLSHDKNANVREKAKKELARRKKQEEVRYV